MIDKVSAMTYSRLCVHLLAAVPLFLRVPTQAKTCTILNVRGQLLCPIGILTVWADLNYELRVSLFKEITISAKPPSSQEMMKYFVYFGVFSPPLIKWGYIAFIPHIIA